MSAHPKCLCAACERERQEPLAKLRRAIQLVLERNGCDCECGHHHEEHGEECERCLACQISDVVSPGRA